MRCWSCPRLLGEESADPQGHGFLGAVLSFPEPWDQALPSQVQGLLTKGHNPETSPHMLCPETWVR